MSPSVTLPVAAVAGFWLVVIVSSSTRSAIRIATALDVPLPHLLPFGERVRDTDELATVLEFERVVTERTADGLDWEIGQSLSLG